MHMYKDIDSILSTNCGCTRGRRTCGCSDKNDVAERHSWGLEDYPLASVYAPLQNFDDLYDEDNAFMKGTIFAELDLPFMGESIARGGSCRG